MRRNPAFPLLILAGLLGSGLVACEREGPAERMGKQIDEAARDIKKDASKAAEEAEEAARDLQDKLKN
jgi:hypothetical protein